MKFDPSARTTDILMFNSKNLGAMIVKQDPQVVSWEDNRYGIQEMAIDEYYGLGAINEGWSVRQSLVLASTSLFLEWRQQNPGDPPVPGRFATV